MKAYACAALVLAVHQPGVGQDARPTFGEPRFPPAKTCGLTFEATRSPGHQALSILRTTKDKNDRDFLAVGGTYGRRVESRCALEILFEAPLAEQEVLSVDARIAEIKQSDAVVSYSLTIGRQTDAVQYARGRWLEGSADTALKRFQVPVAKGSKSVRIKIAGTAVSVDGEATAVIAAESFDLCFIDQAKPDHCGVAGRANPRAGAGQ